MSTVKSVRYRGKDFPVRHVHRTDFKVREPDAYACIESGNRPIPSDFLHAEKAGLYFVVFEGIVPLILKWTGKRWVEVRP